MNASVRKDSSRTNRRSRLVVFPALTLPLFLLPVLAGLLGTWLPALGYLPALGGETLNLAPLKALFAHPAVPSALKVTLVSGLLGTMGAVILTFVFVATASGSANLVWARRLVSPLLAVPHAALAIGMAFLMAPSGLIFRAFATVLGFDQPPDLLIVNDPHGLTLAFALMVKEVPFLLLMTLSALGQVRAEQRLIAARTLGYGPVMAWVKTVLPVLWPLLRLPLYTVLAYSLSVVDMALILGPGTPPSFAVLVLRWFNDPDLSHRFLAAAGAMAQLLLVIGTILAWWAIERLLVIWGRRWIARGGRGGRGCVVALFARSLMMIVLGIGALSLLVLFFWSFARRWRFPDLLPSVWSLGNWLRYSENLLETAGLSFLLATVSALLACMLALGCLEYEQRQQLKPGRVSLWLLYLPLLVPQVAFLFGAQVLLVQARLDGGLFAVVWAHLLFVLPYVYLALAEPFRRLDGRYARATACLGTSANRSFWRVKLPLLLRPVLVAFAVGFSVSIAQYLPTLFAGAGRIVTLTTEAVSLSSGGNRRITSVYALLQAALPLLIFSLAVALPAFIYRNRKGMGENL